MERSNAAGARSDSDITDPAQRSRYGQGCGMCGETAAGHDSAAPKQPALRGTHRRVGVVSGGRDVSNPHAPATNKLAAAMRPVEASTACRVPPPAPTIAPVMAAATKATPSH
jgi:hypothetical protein